MQWLKEHKDKRTDNTMAKRTQRQKDKEWSTLHRKPKIKQRKATHINCAFI